MNSTRLTFSELDKRKGVPPLESAQGEEFPLPAWYRAVYTIPLGNLSSSDLARACRQKIHLETVIPVSISMLRENPLAGDFWEGELMVAVASIPSPAWDSFEELKTEAKNIGKNVIMHLPRVSCRDLEIFLDGLAH